MKLWVDEKKGKRKRNQRTGPHGQRDERVDDGHAALLGALLVLVASVRLVLVDERRVLVLVLAALGARRRRRRRRLQRRAGRIQTRTCRTSFPFFLLSPIPIDSRSRAVLGRRPFRKK